MVLDKSSGLEKLYPQLIAGFGVTMLTIELGVSGGWASPYLAKLTAPNSPIPLSLDQASWVASLLNLGRFLGVFFGVACVNNFGSKSTLLLTLVPVSLCWVLTLLAQDAVWLYLARTSVGVGLGMAYCSFPLFLGEIGLPEIRGALVASAAFGLAAGVVIGNVTGGYLSLVESSIVYLVPCLLLALLFFWLPESPHYLVKVNELVKAKSSIEWYRAGRQVDEEFNAVTKFVSASTASSFSERLAEFRQPVLRRSLILILVLWIIMQLCGSNTIVFYMELILRQGKSTELIEPKVAVMCINIAGCTAAMLSILLIDRFGRRFLLISSSLGTGSGLTGLGIHFCLMENGTDVAENLQWLPLVSMLLFMVSVNFGLVCVPSTVLGELFPANVKAIAALVATLATGISSFGAAKLYQPLIDLIDQSNVYFLHALLTFSLVPYALLCMPETKGKTLQEIQDSLVKR